MNIYRSKSSRVPPLDLDVAIEPRKATIIARHRDAEDGETPFGITTLDLDDPAVKQEWSDHAAWFFPIDSDGIGHPYNRYAYTTPDKGSAQRHLRRMNHSTLATVWVPFAACDDLTQCRWNIQHHPDAVVNGVEFSGEQEPLDGIAPYLPTLKMDGPTAVGADGVATIGVTVIDAATGKPATLPATVYLEALSGYLPKQRLVVMGAGTFRAMALGLSRGDEMEIRAGFKFVSNLASARMRVVG